MKFLVDAQLPPSLVQWLCANGVEAVHVEQVGLRDASDQSIRDRAIEQAYVLITKDRDFVPADRLRSAGFKVIWIRTGNISNRVLLKRLAAAWPRIIAHLQSGASIVELR